jgi:CDP-paratose 2-epimerase
VVKPKTILVTGSGGLIGSEAAAYFDHQGYCVVGVENNMRREFFGPSGDTSWNTARLKEVARNFIPLEIDIRNSDRIAALFREHRFDVIIHCAAQPSHDKAREIPLVDFEVNALGTLNLLEAARHSCPEAPFILMSTNKVYGDAPNEKSLIELSTRYDYADPADHEGINENCRIDQTLHSLFGVSKAAADLLAQEYGRYFGMPVGIFRGGCLTGPNHSGVELHGFLSYLVKVACTGKSYTIFGYKGKQVRDNLHSYDVVRAFEGFARNPRCGEVYNLGGGRQNSISILEAIARIEQITGCVIRRVYEDQARKGDHICYITDFRKFEAHYPRWQVTRNLDQILEEIVSTERQRSSSPR